MPKINREEYKVCKEALNEGYEWIARDEDSKKSTFPNELWLYEYKPQRSRIHWLGEGGATKRFGYDNLFQFIKHKDSEPYSIAELIEEYEIEVIRNKLGYLSKTMREAGEAMNEAFRKSFKNHFMQTTARVDESKETEVKTLESIREEIWEEMLRLEDKRKDQWADIKYQTLREVLQKLGHLDEPEVLSQEWISDKSIDTHVDTVNGEIQVTFILDDLKELLVPKQEEVNKYVQGWTDGIAEYVKDLESGENLIVIEKPVIPQFVADWLEEYKEDELIIAAGTVIGNRRFPKDTKVAKWLNEDYVRNSEVFAQAWLAYPNIEVEEEQKYIVKLPMSKNNDNQYATVDYSGNIWIDALPSKYKLTEEEIRGLTKGDILFEHFAVKVEEMEE